MMITEKEIASCTTTVNDPIKHLKEKGIDIEKQHMDCGIEIFDAKIANVQPEELAIEVSGHSKKVENFIKLVAEYGIIEIARTGRTAISSECGSTDKRMKTL